MADFLNLRFLPEPTYYRMQRLHLIPAVEEWWCWMREELIKQFVGQKIVGGDGQCDSPGFSSEKHCYFLMEITTGYIVVIEIRDNRHVGLGSTNIEKEALKKALSRLSVMFWRWLHLSKSLWMSKLLILYSLKTFIVTRTERTLQCKQCA